jgi:predicted lipoprotein with Yx(FWY)xxD motif
MGGMWAAVAVAGLVAGAPQFARAASEALPAGLTVQKSADGLVLASHGKPLYRIDLDRLKKRRRGATAVGGERWETFAAGLWQPVAAPKDLKADGDWSATPGKEGPQLTYKGDPLYTFTGKSLDEAAKVPFAPQYFSGYAAKPTLIADGVPVATLYFHPALYQPAPPKIVAPAGVTAHWSKVAFVFADDSHDLYASRSAKLCTGDCDGLKPFPAPLAALPVGDWRPVLEKNGERYWAYRGRLVYRADATDAEPPAGDWSRLEAR